MRVDKDGGDLLSIPQAEVLPGPPTIGGLVDTVSGGEIGAAQTFPAAHINNFRIGWRDGQCSDRTSGLIVKDRVPGASVVGRFPHPAIVRSHVENVRLSWHTTDRNSTSAAKGSD